MAFQKCENLKTIVTDTPTLFTKKVLGRDAKEINFMPISSSLAKDRA
jgi:hypothetical protein